MSPSLSVAVSLPRVQTEPATSGPVSTVDLTQYMTKYYTGGSGSL